MCRFCIKIREARDRIIKTDLYDFGDRLDELVTRFSAVVVEHENREHIMVTLAPKDDDFTQ